MDAVDFFFVLIILSICLETLSQVTKARADSFAHRATVVSDEQLSDWLIESAAKLNRRAALFWALAMLWFGLALVIPSLHVFLFLYGVLGLS